MKFLKKLFDFNGRLTRLEYLVFGVLLSMLLLSSLSQVHSLYLNIFIVTLCSFIIFFMAIKRGRDSGLSSIVTLILFFLIPTIALNVYIFHSYDKYLAISFILYLLLMPSSKKEIKEMTKIESVSLKIIIFLWFAFMALFPILTRIDESCRVPNFTCMNMRGAEDALKMFKMDNGVYPTTEEGLNALIKNPNPKEYHNYSSKAYLEKFPLDFWQNPILYIHLKTDKRDNFQLISLGADGKYGGEGENEDIVYPDSCK